MPESAPVSKISAIYLELANYPILARQIRHAMREELYRRGVITPERLEQEVREKAILSQQREGLTNVLEDESVWQQRLQTIRDHLIDFYFAYNLPFELFHDIVHDALAERSVDHDELILPFNPEMAPMDMLLRQAERYEALPEKDRAKVC